MLTLTSFSVLQLWINSILLKPTFFKRKKKEKKCYQSLLTMTYTSNLIFVWLTFKYFLNGLQLGITASLYCHEYLNNSPAPFTQIMPGCQCDYSCHCNTAYYYIIELTPSNKKNVWQIANFKLWVSSYWLS